MDGSSVLQTVELEYAGESSTFAGRLASTKPGRFDLQVLAMDAPNANFGEVRTEVVVR